MSQHVLPAVENPLPLLRVQLVDEVCGVVVVGVLVPGSGKDEVSIRSEPGYLPAGRSSPEDQPSLDARLHLLCQMLHVCLSEGKETA